MKNMDEPGKAPEVRIAELEKLTGRLRIGLVLVGSLILYQGTWEMGLLGPVRVYATEVYACLLYTSPSPRDRTRTRMPSSA